MTATSFYSTMVDDSRESKFRKSLEDIRKQMRANLCRSRTSSRRTQIMLNRTSLPEILRDHYQQQTTLDGWISSNQDEVDWGHDVFQSEQDYNSCQYESSASERSPSPASSRGSLESQENIHLDSLPGHLFEDERVVARKDLRKVRAKRESIRNDLYKQIGIHRTDKRRTPIDEAKATQEFITLVRNLKENHNDPSQTCELLNNNWQILLNSLRIQDSSIHRTTLQLLTHYASLNLISAQAVENLLTNGLMIHLQNVIWIAQSTYVIPVCDLLLALIQSQPACSILAIQLFLSTSVPDILIDAIRDAVNDEKHTTIQFYHRILQQMLFYLEQVTSSKTPSAQRQQLEVLDILKKIITPDLIESLIHNLKFQETNKIVYMTLVILDSALKICYHFGEENWVNGILAAFRNNNIEHNFRSLLKTTFKHQEDISSSILQFLSVYRLYFKELSKRYVPKPERVLTFEAW